MQDYRRHTPVTLIDLKRRNRFDRTIILCGAVGCVVAFLFTL